MRLTPLLIVLVFATGCAIRPESFTESTVPPPPDYKNDIHWAALPQLKDMADLTPGPQYPDMQATAQADVFFIHPTIFTQKSKSWNADLSDEKQNREVAESTIKFQASLFNEAGSIYAPRYRQAHLRSFFDKDKVSSKEALDLAYSDVRNAFEYYLRHYNMGRPFIIAGHSQGARHGLKLVKDLIDDTALREKLVAAYLIGWPVPKNAFDNIPPCETPTQTGCVCSWRTWLWGHSSKADEPPGSILVTNPLVWSTTETYASTELNEGSVLRKFEQVLPGIADAKVEGNILWTHKPKFPGSFFFRRKNYHIGDLNLYYINVRKNASARVEAFLKRKVQN